MRSMISRVIERPPNESSTVPLLIFANNSGREGRSRKNGKEENPRGTIRCRVPLRISFPFIVASMNELVSRRSLAPYLAHTRSRISRINKQLIPRA